MTIGEHLQTFDGRPVQDWRPGEPLPDLARVALRVADDEPWENSGEDTITASLRALVAEAGSLVESLVIGAWRSSFEAGPQSVVDALIGLAPELPNLKAIFVGDLTFEECEISWMFQADLTPLLNAYPSLECLGSRGTQGLRLGPVRHASLRSLLVQSGGLPSKHITEIVDSDLPSLSHLELWIGDQNYGNDVTATALKPLLVSRSTLRYLGLRNADNADEIARAVSDAPVLNDVDVLDLSLGTLTDEGAEALLASSKIRQLQRLDLHHHYLSDAMTDRISGIGIDVDVSERKEAEVYSGEEYRSVFASE